MIYNKRFYRNFSKTSRWKNFQVKVDSTDLYIKACENFSSHAKKIVIRLRNEIKNHIKKQREFFNALKPVPRHEKVPPVVEKMYKASEAAGVGPMAAVAGAIAESVGKALSDRSSEVIVENGGDIYINIIKPAAVSVFAGESPLSEKIGIKIYPDKTPVGICTSSGTVGHSLSFGKADAATVIASRASLADAVATGAANMIRSAEDLDTAIEYAMGIKNVSGILLVFKNKIAVKGNIELCSP